MSVYFKKHCKISTYATTDTQLFSNNYRVRIMMQHYIKISTTVILIHDILELLEQWRSQKFLLEGPKLEKNCDMFSDVFL